MSKLKQTVTITTGGIPNAAFPYDPSPPTTPGVNYHIPASANDNETTTLCALRPIHKRYNAKEYPPTCPRCLEVWQWVRELEIG